MKFDVDTCFLNELSNSALGSKKPSLVQTLAWLNKPGEYLEKSQERYGDNFYIDVFGWGRVIFVCEPKIVNSIFSSEENMLSGGKANEILTPVVGKNSIFTQEGKAHKRKRNSIKRSLQFQNFSKNHHIHLGIIERNIQSSGANTNTIDDTTFRSITLQIMINILFGKDDPDLAKHLQNKLQPLIGTMSSILAFIPSLQKDFGCFSPIRIFEAKKRDLDKLIYSEINHSIERETPSLSQELFGTYNDKADVRDQLVSLLIAGNDTTAASLSWLHYWVFSNSRVIAHLKDELSQNEIGTSSSLNAQNIMSLPYLDATISESLRIVPTVDFYPRKMGEASEALFFAPCSYLIQRDDRYFPKAKHFIPERFLEAKKFRNTYLPFGGGKRRCPGSTLSIYILKLVLIYNLLSKKDYKISDHLPHPIRRNVILTPSKYKMTVVQ